jgi:hypothetical protein
LTFFNSCTAGKTDLNITRKVMQGREIRGQPGVHRLIPPKAIERQHVSMVMCIELYVTTMHYHWISKHVPQKHLRSQAQA